MTAPREHSQCPPGGDGFYYFSAYFLVRYDEYGIFDIQMNGERLCTSDTEQHDTPGDPGQAACSSATYATEGMKKMFAGMWFKENK